MQDSAHPNQVSNTYNHIHRPGFRYQWTVVEDLPPYQGNLGQARIKSFPDPTASSLGQFNLYFVWLACTGAIVSADAGRELWHKGGDPKPRTTRPSCQRSRKRFPVVEEVRSQRPALFNCGRENRTYASILRFFAGST